MGSESRSSVPSRAGGVEGAARRVDWRFLLPCHGAPGALSSLCLVSDEPDVVTIIHDLQVAMRVQIGYEDRKDVQAAVVLTNRLRDIDRASGNLRAGDVLYCSIDRARLTGLMCTPRRLRRRLATAGFETAIYWRRRQAGRDTLFLPLDAPGAILWYVRELMAGGSLRRRLARRALTATISRVGTGWLKTVVPHYGLVGVVRQAESNPQQTGTTPAVLHASMETTEPLFPLVLARGEGAWSRIVLLPFSVHDPEPRCVVKLPRTPEHNEATEREHATLTQLAAQLPPALAAGVPAPRGLHQWHGLAVGAEGFLPGRPLASTGGLEGAVDWLADLHRATRVEDLPVRLSRVQHLVDGPVLDAAAAIGLPEASVAELLRRRGIGTVTGTDLIVVMQHRDVTPRNMRWGGNGYSLVDWESARPGPALCDLLYLMLHWPWPNLPRFGSDPHNVFRSVFLDQDTPAARRVAVLVDRYCRALPMDEQLISPLLLTMLGQQALDRADRVRYGGGDPSRDHNIYGELIRIAAERNAFRKAAMA